MWSRTVREMQIPPGSASPSRRAATLTPSAKMSPSLTMTSPRFDADPKPDLAILGHSGLAIDHCALHFGAAADRVDDALELGQEAVAGILYDRPRCSAIFGST